MNETFVKDLHELIFWARRYCDGRCTYAPSSFNQVYERMRKIYPEIKELDKNIDTILTEKGKFFPYAQDGMYNESNGRYDAVPRGSDVVECKKCGETIARCSCPLGPPINFEDLDESSQRIVLALTEMQIEEAKEKKNVRRKQKLTTK